MSGNKTKSGDRILTNLKRERQNHELKLIELKTDVYKSKRPLKEMGEVMKRETASLERIFRKKELENELEVARLRLLQKRKEECLFVRHVGSLEEFEVFYREKYAGDELALTRTRESIELAQKELVKVRVNIRGNEEQQLSKSKELDAINAALGSNDKGSATATTPTDEPGPVKMPTMRAPTTNTSMPSAPPSSSATPSPEGQKVTPRKEKKKSRRDEKNSQLEMERELRRNKERELDIEQDQCSALAVHFFQHNAIEKQKRDKLEGDLKRERKYHVLTLSALETDVYKSKRPLKEIGGIMKRETANLERIFRKKELELEREITRLNLLENQGWENISKRKLGIIEKHAELLREKYAGSKTALEEQLQLLHAHYDKCGSKKYLLKARKNIRNNEYNLRLINEDLDAINAELRSNDDDTAIVTTSTAADPSLVKTPTEHALTSTSLSASCNDNPPAAPPSSLAIPPPDGQKHTHYLEMNRVEQEELEEEEEGEEDDDEEEEEEGDEEEWEGWEGWEEWAKRKDEIKAAFEELVREKEADLTKRKDVIESLSRRMAEELQKMRGVGACERDSNATDPTDAELIAMGPVAVTYNKYRKLNRSLMRDHDVKKCELDIEIAKFTAKALRTERSLLMLKVDQLEEPTEGCDAEDQRHYDDQLLVYQAELTRMNEEIDECNGRCELLEQRLLELDAERDGDALVPTANKPSSLVPSPADEQAPSPVVEPSAAGDKGAIVRNQGISH